MKKEFAISVLRKEVGRRDGLDCVPCRILGYCDPKGRGWCSGIQLVSPDLSDVTYWRLDGLRAGNASLRMHLSHLHGKNANGWFDLVFSCPCHNLNITTPVRTVCEEYVAQFVGTETPAFLEAYPVVLIERHAAKEKKAKARHAAYVKQKARAGGTPLSKMKEKPAKKINPASGGKKYSSTKWAAFDALPRFNSNP